MRPAFSKLQRFAVVNPDVKPDCLIATCAIRPGEWLATHVDWKYRLYVADEDAADARALWPDVERFEIDNARRCLGPPKESPHDPPADNHHD